MADVGVDLDRKRSQVVALDPAGQVLVSRRIGNAPTEFWRIFGELEPQPIQVAFEATYGWELVRGPAGRRRRRCPPGPSAGHQGHLGRPGHQRRRGCQDPGPSAGDQPAGRGLDRPPAAREARRLVRTRAGLVRMRSRVQSQLHALLADLGVIPELTTLFGPAGRRWLAELGMAASARGRLDAGLRLIDALTVEVGRADAELRSAFAGDDRPRRLLPIPGIGLVTAATVVAAVWDIQHFPSPQRLCSWAGLGPGERTSDAHTRRGHTRQAGLAVAALDAGRGGHHHHPRPTAGPLHRPDRRRRGPKIARVALARRRRRLTLCFYALRDDGGCRADPANAR